MKIKAVYLQAGTGIWPEVIEVDRDSLEELYKLINCDGVGITRRRIGFNNYLVICDDEGLFKEDPIVSAVYGGTFQRAFVGNLLVCGLADEYGNLTGLNKAQQNEVLMCTAGYVYRSKKQYVFVLGD